MRTKSEEVRESVPRAEVKGVGARVPKLRFPEFMDAGEWGKVKLEDISNLVNNKAPVGQFSLRNYVNTESLLPDYSGISTPSSLPSSGNVTVFAEGDILVSNIRPYLKKAWFSDRDGGVSNDVLVFRAKQRVDKVYLSFLIKNDAFIAYVMNGAKGLKMPRGDIPLILNYLLAVPSLPEQQKIAACLSSIDSLLSAHSKKLNALKKYKQGLMQQLFPAEREGLPRLRFPEFRDAGEWEEKKAGALFINRIEEGEAGLPIYSVTMNDGMILRSLLDRNFDDIAEPEGNKKAYKNDIAYNMMRMWQGALGVAVEDCMVSPAYVILEPSDGVCSDFYGYLLKLPRYLRPLTSHSQGLTSDRLRLYYRDFAHIPLPRPTLPEQQKTAACLSSIDELIVAQAAQIEKLKLHKKGLMQGLFPQVDKDDR